MGLLIKQFETRSVGVLCVRSLIFRTDLHNKHVGFEVRCWIYFLARLIYFQAISTQHSVLSFVHNLRVRYLWGECNLL